MKNIKNIETQAEETKTEPQEVKIVNFEPVLIGEPKNPIFVIGMCPGKLRKKDTEAKAWSGDRAGSLMRQIIEGLGNAYLTNVFKKYVVGKITNEIIADGLSELEKDVKKYKPKLIVCFGQFATKHVY